MRARGPSSPPLPGWPGFVAPRWRRVWDLNPRTFPSGAFKAPALGRYANPPAARGIAVAGCTPHHRIRVGGAVQPVRWPAVRGRREGGARRGDPRGDVGRHAAAPGTRPGASGGSHKAAVTTSVKFVVPVAVLVFGRARLWVQPAPSRRTSVCAGERRRPWPSQPPRCPMSQPTATAPPRRAVAHPVDEVLPPAEARDLRPPARPGVLRRRGHRADPAGRRHRADPASS